jgi:chromate reductase
MPDSLDVLVICGSLRKQSYNRMVCNTLPELAPQGMRLIEAPEIGTTPLYNADIQNESGFPEPSKAMAEAVRAADGVIIVTPEYNFSIPGVLKNAIDWISRMPDQPFNGKPVALQSASTGLLGGSRCQYHLRQVMAGIDAIVFTRPEVVITFAKTKVDEEKGIVADEMTRKTIETQLSAFEKFIKRLGPAS